MKKWLTVISFCIIVALFVDAGVMGCKLLAGNLHFLTEAYISLIGLVALFAVLLLRMLLTRCPHCGKRTQPVGKYCPFCGKPME